jgi:hypothetical protein
VAYLKFSRDKRGYEHFYLVQPSNRGKARPRMLYWFRTPPGVRVGRSPFDPDMRRALEAQNPDVVFDWEAIASTPIPPVVEPERWRERRRVERAFRETEEAASTPDTAEQPAQSEMSEMTVNEPSAEPSTIEVEELTVAAAEPVAIEGLPRGPQSSEATQGGVVPPDHQGRRRRRRRGRRKPQVQGSGFTVQGSQVQGSQVPGDESNKAISEEPVIQDSGEPEE